MSTIGRYLSPSRLGGEHEALDPGVMQGYIWRKESPASKKYHKMMSVVP